MYDVCSFFYSAIPLFGVAQPSVFSPFKFRSPGPGVDVDVLTPFFPCPGEI